MRMLRTTLLASVAAIAPLVALGTTSASAAKYQHVLLISVDGLHEQDLARWIAQPGSSALKSLSQAGTVFTNAMTTFPSDSFPGMVAQVTGASPKTAGVFYDDSFDRQFFQPASVSGGRCAGEIGAETRFFEFLDKTYNQTTGVVAGINGGGILNQPLTQIAPGNLPQRQVGGKCEYVLPHQYLRANTVFEIIKAAGLRTAWSDKHPAYEILNGPSGKGIDDLYAPEINSGVPGEDGNDYTTGYAAVQYYDATKVQAVLNEIDGYDSLGLRKAGVPAILGMNFQAVSVGQKLAKSGTFDPPGLVGGYLDAKATPGNALSEQLAFVDSAIGSMVAELQAQGLANSTLVIISAKHGQSPIDRSLRHTIPDGKYFNTTNIPALGFYVADDEVLLWLQPQLRTEASLAQTKAWLVAHAAEIGAERILDPNDLGLMFQYPLTDARTPDFVVISKKGTIYTKGTKLAEHGGDADDDRHVALLVSAPTLRAKVATGAVETKQIAPTILTALGLDPNKLNGVQKEGTTALPY